MTPKSIFSNLAKEPDGTWTTVYGPFVLKSALQPIFRRLGNGRLNIDSFEGLVRPYKADEAVSPAEFFPSVNPVDIEAIDSLLRTLHILNTGYLDRSKARIFVNFHPGLFRTPGKMRQEVERMRLAAHEAGMTPDRIVCEFSDKKAEDTQLIADFASHMHAIGFRVAIDDYGAGDSDIERVKLVKPDYVKFEASWVRDFMSNSAGAALLRVIVRQFMDDGIEPVFEALEENWQVELCGDLGVNLMQGYALARPEIAPTTFDERFPELDEHGRIIYSGVDQVQQHLYRDVTPVESRILRPIRAFGKRKN